MVIGKRVDKSRKSCENTCVQYRNLVLVIPATNYNGRDYAMATNAEKEPTGTQIVITLTAKHVLVVILTIIGALIGTLITIFTTVWLNIPLKGDVNTRFNSMETRFNQMEARLNQMPTRNEMQAGFNTINAKLDGIIQRLDSHESRIAENAQKFNNHISEHHATKD
jgi:hypothetical protein